MALDAVIESGRAMSYYWALVEHVDNRKLRELSKREEKDKFGLFYDNGLSANLDQACLEWRPLLLAVMEISVEPRRLDIQNALKRFTGVA